MGEPIQTLQQTITAKEVIQRANDVLAHMKADRPGVLAGRAEWTYLEWMEIHRMSGEMIDALGNR